MTTRPPRVTMAVLDILDALSNAPADDPPWGLRLCEMTGLGSGTVYPALERMAAAGWVTDRLEEPQPTDRPRRRYFTITDEGQAVRKQAVARWRQS